MDLSALVDFHLVVDAGSFSRASRDTGRPKATLSRRVRALEQSLGLRLLERGQHALHLTEDGRALFERTRALVREIEEVGQSLVSGNTAPRGLLRISAPTLFATTFGGRIAAGFAKLHQQVQLELVGEDRRVDLVEDGYDIAIRVNPQPDSELVGRCFARDRMWLVAAPGLLPPPPQADGSPASVAAVAMLGLPRPAGWQVERGGQRWQVAPDFRLRLSSLLMVREAVLAGAGAACLPSSIVRDAVDAGRLSVWNADIEDAVELWALHASRRLVSPKVAAFLQYLVTAFPERRL
ncbi:MAG: LysR family transcriptional regulator [Stenotrophomonas sp.]|uniref:LysR family transcriptional regulator n=1 Tax=Stenotrophomonas sp. TaxID=69392 RepID=UPI003D6DA7F9